MLFSRAVPVAVMGLMCCHVTLAAFITLGTGCYDRGVHHHPDELWYHDGECARYGCFNPTNPMAYKVTCPRYPIPDCHYRLVSSPDAPFPKCCVSPVCI